MKTAINPKAKTDKRYEIQEPWRKIIPALLFRSVTLIILVLVVYLGASGSSFGLSDKNIAGVFVLSTDIQLAILGLANKILDYLVTLALHHISAAFLTKWMVLPNNNGARMQDLELHDELSKPWVAVKKFVTTIRSPGRRKEKATARAIVRLVLSLAISISTLLLGASVNVIGMPKARWFPDPRYISEDDPRYYFTSPQAQIQTIDFMNIWQDSWEMIREGQDPSWVVVRVDSMPCSPN
ncbi:hypothetical protein VTN77DRAFT_3275 [Rasamsonia byssochlamydoides]|uniref:uncharacterized protein n=1 Tax=Rasamsonia byssochlamydoides TaxID=89139 RepID=UPI00374337B3